jgi:23S rRNA G2445 N2-methylase RlmL
VTVSKKPHEGSSGQTGAQAQSLEERLRHPAFTPGRKDFAPMLSLLAKTEDFDKLSKILLRAGAAPFRELAQFLKTASLSSRRQAEFLRLLVSLFSAPRSSPKEEPDEELLAEILLSHVSNTHDPVVRRWSALGAGRVPWRHARVRVAATLADVLREGLMRNHLGVDESQDQAQNQAQDQAQDQAHDQSVMRALVETLGKITMTDGASSDVAALAGDVANLLKDLSENSDLEPHTRKVLDTALLRLGRDAARVTRKSPTWKSDVPQAGLVFRCREGLEDVLAGEITEVLGAARVLSRGRVAAAKPVSLRDALKIRCAEDFVLPFEPKVQESPLVLSDDHVDESQQALLAELVGEALNRFAAPLQPGPSSWAVRFQSGRPRRSLVAAVARLVSRKAAADQSNVAETRDTMLNDARSPLWEIEVDDLKGTVELAVRPSGFLREHDQRFLWREDTVAASSHAPLAAAIARLGGAQEGDIVWDPFCGAGAELVERALLGPSKKIIGTDISDKALAAARSNATRAGVDSRMEFIQASALSLPVAQVSLVFSNPPLGKRVARGREDELLLNFARVLPRVLAPEARVVIVVPPGLHDFHIEGLTKSRQYRVDLGGFDASLQVWVRPGRS